MGGRVGGGGGGYLNTETYKNAGNVMFVDEVANTNNAPFGAFPAKCSDSKMCGSTTYVCTTKSDLRT